MFAAGRYGDMATIYSSSDGCIPNNPGAVLQWKYRYWGSWFYRMEGYDAIFQIGKDHFCVLRYRGYIRRSFSTVVQLNTELKLN